MHFSGLTGSCYHQWAKWKTSWGFTRNESTTISLSLLSRRPIYFGHFSNLSLVHDLVLDLLVCHDHQVDCLWEGTPIEGNHESDGVGKLGTLALMVYWQLCRHDVLIRNAFPAPKSKSFSWPEMPAWSIENPVCSTFVKPFDLNGIYIIFVFL